MSSLEVSAYKAGFTPLATLRSSLSAPSTTPATDETLRRLSLPLLSRSEIRERAFYAMLSELVAEDANINHEAKEIQAKQKIQKLKAIQILKKKAGLKISLLTVSILMTVAANVAMFIDTYKNNKDCRRPIALLVIHVSAAAIFIFACLAAKCLVEAKLKFAHNPPK